MSRMVYEMHVLVCGARDWTNSGAVRRELENLGKNSDNVSVVHGGCSGADDIAGKLSVELGMTEIRVPAEWKRYGRAAGPIRNQKMLDMYPIELVLAFHPSIENSRGTKDMVSRAKKKNVSVSVFDS